MIELNITELSEHVGSSFRLSAEGLEPVDMKLAEVNSLSADDPNRDESIRSEPFALLFRSSSLDPLPQQIYKLEHDVLGSLDLFLVPVGPDKAGSAMCYEAVFN